LEVARASRLIEEVRTRVTSPGGGDDYLTSQASDHREATAADVSEGGSS
jgi:hypothetical protein